MPGRTPGRPTEPDHARHQLPTPNILPAIFRRHPTSPFRYFLMNSFSNQLRKLLSSKQWN
jgi:hypothetical protein